MALENLRETVAEKDEKDIFKPTLDSLEQLVLLEKEDDFDISREYIERAIKREMLSAIAGQHGIYEELILKTDKTILQAVEILNTPGQYSEHITYGKTEDDPN